MLSGWSLSENAARVHFSHHVLKRVVLEVLFRVQSCGLKRSLNSFSVSPQLYDHNDFVLVSLLDSPFIFKQINLTLFHPLSS